MIPAFDPSGPAGFRALSPQAVAPEPGADPARRAAADLHRQFLSQMLRASGLGEAFTGKGAGGEAAALADFAFDAIASEMAAAQPRLTENLYQALRRAGGEGEA